MILLAPEHLERIAAEAEAAYPAECCGLLVGHERAEGGFEVVRVAPSPNVDPRGGGKRFEIDPRLLLKLQRELRDGTEKIVGHYHSHPDHPALPSARDLERAWEPGRVWLITSVVGGTAVGTTAYIFEPSGGFREVGIETVG